MSTPCSIPPEKSILPNRQSEEAKSKPSIFERELRDQLKCGNPRTVRRVDDYTGEIAEWTRLRYDGRLKRRVEVRCRANRCWACAIWNARRSAGAIWISQPDFVITLTLAGDDYETICGRVTRFINKVKLSHPTFQYAWICEPNADGTECHVHLYAHTEDGRLRKQVAERAWPSRIDVRRVPTGAPVTYFGYPFKNLTDPSRAPIFLALNGVPSRQALVHAGHGFWRDGRGGQRLTKRDAEKVALRKPGKVRPNLEERAQHLRRTFDGKCL